MCINVILTLPVLFKNVQVNGKNIYETRNLF